MKFTEVQQVRRNQIPDEVWNALTHPDNAGYPPTEVLTWSGEEIFKKYCEWEGLLGSWHHVLWRIIPPLTSLKAL